MYIFLKSRNSESHNNNSIMVAKKEWFSTMSIGNTYGNYGVAVDEDEAGSYNVIAYNFHNGSNWESVILDSPCDEDIEFDQIEDKGFTEAIHKKEYVKEENGYTYFKFKGLNVVQSHWQGSWALFEIYPD